MLHKHDVWYGLKHNGESSEIIKHKSSPTTVTLHQNTFSESISYSNFHPEPTWGADSLEALANWSWFNTSAEQVGSVGELMILDPVRKSLIWI